MATRSLNVTITGDARNFNRALQQAGGSTSRFQGVLDKLKVAGPLALAAAGGAAIKLGASFVHTASDINESLTKNQVLFGKYAKGVDQFSRTSATSFGISRKAALEYTGVFGNLFSSLDVSAKKSAGMSVKLTKLAGDMASFNNTSIDDALEAIRSGLVGETEPLRRFGVNLQDATLRQEAMSLGLTHTTKNVLTPYQRMMAAQSLIVKQTEKAHGDFHRTQKGLANQTRILQARFSDITGEIGGKLLPIVVDVARAVNRFLDDLRRRRGVAGQFRAAFEDMGHGLQRVAKWVENALKDIRGALRATTGAVRAMVNTSNAILRGDWKDAWRNAKLTVTQALAGDTNSVLHTLNTLRDPFQAAAERLAEAVIRGLLHGFNKLEFSVRRKIVDGIGKAFRGIPGIINDAAQGVGKSIGKAIVHAIPGNPFGDGIGKLALASRGPAGGLHGADGALRPFAGIASRFGLSITAGRDDHSTMTSSGNLSYHATGEALDFSNGYETPQEMAFARYMVARFGGRLAELIYTPLGFSIKDGQRVPPIAAEEHHNHVHVAMDLGRPGPGIGDGRGKRKGDGIGKFVATSYGPPWGGIQGGGVTATGVNLKNNPHVYGIAVDPRRLRLGRNYYVWPNPFGHRGAFRAFDTGGAIKGNRIDFYDWRGRSAQNGWGTRAVTISDSPPSSGGGGGGGGAYRWPGESVARHSRPFRGGNNRTGGGGGGGGGDDKKPVALVAPGGGGYEQRLDDASLAEARARSKNNLAGLIKALQSEIALKRHRLKTVRKALRRRLRPETRKRLTEEATTLIGEIGDLRESLTEFRADAKGGAKTISRAEVLEHGRDPDLPEKGVIRPGGTMAGVEADTGGDTTGGDTGGTGEDPNAALIASQEALRAAIEQHAATEQSLRDEFKRANDIADQAGQSELAQIKKWVADVAAGQVAGRTRSRGFTPGNGVALVY